LPVPPRKLNTVPGFPSDDAAGTCGAQIVPASGELVDRQGPEAVMKGERSLENETGVEK
jgi:hypothetical protein